MAQTRLVFVLALVCSCGRIGFSGSTDAAVGDGQRSDAAASIDAPIDGTPDAPEAIVSVGCGPDDPCVCATGERCEFTCTEPVCVIECEDDSRCDITCSPGSRCEYTCSSLARCEIDCRDGGECAGECAEDVEECRLRCPEQDCEETDCGPGVCTMMCSDAGQCISG